jgi:molecular chaperone GrpE
MKAKRGAVTREPGAQPDAEHAEGGPQAVRGDDDLATEVGHLREREEELLRALAELTNVQKRRKAESEQTIRYAQESLIRELLSVVDDFERALAAMPVSPDDPIRAGVELVYQRLIAILEKEGLAPIRPAGEPFDPNLHDAIGERPAPPGVPPGVVLDVAQPGYSLRDRILRHAKVVVASAPEVGPTQTAAPPTHPAMEGNVPRPPDTIDPPLHPRDKRGA